MLIRLIIASFFGIGFLSSSFAASGVFKGSWGGAYVSNIQNCEGDALVINIDSKNRIINSGVLYKFGKLKGTVSTIGEIVMERFYFGKRYIFIGTIENENISGTWKTKNNKCFGTWSAQKPLDPNEGL